jgi:copper chaperone CopZ
MHCGHCVARVESALARLDGVKLADASLEGGEAVVVFEKSKLGASKLVETIDALGFKAGTPVQR